MKLAVEEIIKVRLKTYVRPRRSLRYPKVHVPIRIPNTDSVPIMPVFASPRFHSAFISFMKMPVESIIILSAAQPYMSNTQPQARQI
jgi:hypothetical protein